MRCCVTGHRPEKFPFKRLASEPKFVRYCHLLFDKLDELIGEGYDYFYTGLAEGADLDFAKAVLKHNEKYKTLFLEGAMPYPRKPSAVKTERDRIIERCDKVIIHSPSYIPGCMQKRNEYMVDNSDLVIAIWNGKRGGGTWNTIEYARQRGKRIFFIRLDEI